jgi:low temperature requirement protein LtrA
VLVDGGDAAALAQVVVMLLLIWWMYDGYAWLTNAIATDRLRFGLLLIGGMGAFLVIALAVPNAYDGDGLAFGLGYLVVVLLHAGMFVRGTSVSEVRAMLRIAPFNLIAVTLVLIGGSLGDDPQLILWAVAGILLWFTPRFTTVEGFVVSVSHFVERHGLVVIVALGESIVVIGTGAAGLALDEGLVLAALLPEPQRCPLADLLAVPLAVDAALNANAAGAARSHRNPPCLGSRPSRRAAPRT